MVIGTRFKTSIFPHTLTLSHCPQNSKDNSYAHTDSSQMFVKDGSFIEGSAGGVCVRLCDMVGGGIMRLSDAPEDHADIHK